MRGSREISLVPSLHRASTDALILVSMGHKGLLVRLLKTNTTITTTVVVQRTRRRVRTTPRTTAGSSTPPVDDTPRVKLS